MAAQKFYAAVGNEDLGVIYGIGTSKQGAIQDALEGAGYRDMESCLEDGNSGFTAREMTERYYLHVKANGFNGQTDVYTERGGMIDFSLTALARRIEEMIENTHVVDVFDMLENCNGAELTGRLIPGDENFEYPEWVDDAEIDGVPVNVTYRTTPGDQAFADKAGDWGNIDWKYRLESVSVDWEKIDD